LLRLLRSPRLRATPKTTNMEKLSSPVSLFLERYGMHPASQDVKTNAELFLDEMRNGLSGNESSIKMLPGFLSLDFERRPEGHFAVIDAGGTNFRTCLVSFSGSEPHVSDLKLSPMPGSSGDYVSWAEFIDYTAMEVLPLLKRTRKVGFCFSYPTFMYPDGDGSLVMLTKQIKISGFEGRRILADLAERLSELGERNIEITLLNDTLAVLLSAFAETSLKNHSQTFGLIVGTGLNTAAFFDNVLIKKLPELENGESLINLESGGFSKIIQGDFDIELDKTSQDPGKYKYEKMCSGAYLGRLSEITLRKAAIYGLFTPEFAKELEALMPIDSVLADAIALGISPLPKSEGSKTASEIVGALIERAAKLVSANLLAIALLQDGYKTSREFCVSADGSLFRKCMPFRSSLINYSKQSFKETLSSEINFVSPENGTAIGTAVSAALRRI
jgi:hexokinase